MAKLSDKELAYLAAYEEGAEEREPDFPECERAPKKSDDRELWWPALSPTQHKVFDCYTQNVVVHGSRGTGKGIACLHKCVRHAWENWDALVMMTSVTITAQIAGGPWFDLYDLVLPQWEENIGVEWVGPKYDQAKNAYIKVANRYGGWSTIMMKAIPNRSVISQRFKGTAPSMIYFDELTEASDRRYFHVLAQQLGRRRGIKNQQFIAATNPSPEGKKHWVYKEFIAGPQPDDEGYTEESRKHWEKHYASFFIPMSENIFMENRDEYVAKLKALAVTDPTEYARIVEGEWVEQQLGEGIYKDFFRPNIHVRGNVKEGRRFHAQPENPIIAGYDLGDVNNGVVFMQQRMVKDKLMWVVLDELVIKDRAVPLPTLVYMIMEKMNSIVMLAAQEKNMPPHEAREKFIWEHISDASTLRFRKEGGDIERNLIDEESARIIREQGQHFPYLKDSIFQIPAPKGDGSVAFRFRELATLMQMERIVFDSGCVNLIESIQKITSADKQGGSPFDPARGSKWKHALDALTYALIYYKVTGDPLTIKKQRKPRVYA